MSIETSPVKTATKPATAKAAGSAKPQGPVKGVPEDTLGFGAILAAEDVPVADAQSSQDPLGPLSPVTLEEKSPVATVDIAQPAINIIATVAVVPVLPVGLSDIDGAAPSAAPAQAGDLSAVPPTLVPDGFAQARGPGGPAASSAVRSAGQDATPPPRAADAALAAADTALAAVDTKASKATKPGVLSGEIKSPASGVDSGKKPDTQFFAAMEAMKSMQSAKEPPIAVLGAALVATGLSEPHKSDKAGATTDATTLTYSLNAPTLGTTSYASTAVADPTQVSPDMQVAEQVTYWISQDVQNAELTLDGLGKDPVEVSIRMSGNEAQVAFRTDELQTRDLLENAAVHLKELLQREGLVLAGVSVGTSGSGEAGGRQHPPPQSGRQTASVLAGPDPVTVRRAPTGAQGRSLDLFV